MMRAVVGVLIAALALASACARHDDPKVLRLFAWSEYVPRAVIDGFTAETGIRVEYESFSSNEEMLAKLVAGAQRYDLIQPSDYVVEALRKDDRLLRLDHAKLPNLVHIDPRYRELAYDPGLAYSVPWMQGSVGIVVNTARVSEAIHGYGDVFQEKHRRRILVVDDPRELVSWALVSIGENPNAVTSESLARATPVLRQWLPLIKVFESDSPKTAFLNGDVDLGVVWSGEAARLYREDKKFRFVLPREGAHQFVDTLAIPANAANPDGAHAFIDYALRPEIGRLVAIDFPYTHPNLGARRLLTAEELSNPASYPPGDPVLDLFRDIGAQAVAIDKLVTDLRAAN